MGSVVSLYPHRRSTRGRCNQGQWMFFKRFLTDLSSDGRPLSLSLKIRLANRFEMKLAA